MIGTLVNALAIVVGGAMGLMIKKGLPQRVEEGVMKILGLVVVIIGLNGVISAMFTISDTGRLQSSGDLLLLGSLVLGAIVGEFIDIDARLERFGKFVESKTNSGGFSNGFISATLIYCVGAMGILGSLNDGLVGDSSVLFVKSSLDGISAIILASTLGYGVIFSAIPVVIYQGSISLVAMLLRNLIAAGDTAALAADPMLGAVFMVGYVMVAAIGLNLMELCRIRVANLLPALAVPLLYYGVLSFL